MRKIIGQTLQDQFRVDAFLASGGMGSVYKVWDLQRSVPLAMKVLHTDLAEDPSVLKHFKREASALKNLTHPNIVPFYGLFEEDDFAYLLQRYIDGPSLKEVMRADKGKPLPLADTLTYLRVLCAALGYAHAKGVVHCDVKPGNVMIDQGGNIFLTDFGIARHAESTTTTMASIGTAAYMAPEQVLARPVTPAADIYALGVMLFEMTTDVRPFRGEGTDSKSDAASHGERIRAQHLNAPPPDPRELNPEIPEALAVVILQALDKDPECRFVSTQALFRAACRAAGVEEETVPERVHLAKSFYPADGPHPTTSPSGTGQLPKATSPVESSTRSRRNRRAAWGFIGLVLLLLAGAAYFFGGSLAGTGSLLGALGAANQPSQAETIRQTQFALELAMAADQTRVASVDTQGTMEARVQSTVAAQAMQATGTAIQATSDAQATAGSILAVQASATQAALATTATQVVQETLAAQGTVGALATATAKAEQAITALAQATKVAFFENQEVWIVSIDGSNLKQLTSDGTTKTNLRWMPDGEKVAYISGKCVQTVDIFTAEVSTLVCFNFALYVEGFEVSADGRYIGFSVDRILYIAAYDPSKTLDIQNRNDLIALTNCYTYTRNATKLFRFAPDSSKLAVSILGVGNGGLWEDYVMVHELKCTKFDLVKIDQFPGQRFRPLGFDQDPVIQNFGWNGGNFFALVGNQRNGGFGDLWIYNTDTKSAQVENPIDGKCCYRDPHWSPDGEYLIFTFQDASAGNKSQLYYIPFNRLGSGAQYAPIPLPEDLLTNPLARPELAVGP